MNSKSRSRSAAAPSGRRATGATSDAASQAYGIGGRHRTTGAAAERARAAVTHRIRGAIRRIADVDPELGRHLFNAVRTGTFCSYQPETSLEWSMHVVDDS